MDSYDWARIIPAWVFPGWATLLGLVLGSFANVCIHRLPEHRSVVRPRSACPHCGHGIRAVDNVPLLSWLVLRGRCRSCGAAISPRYPLVEALSGVLFLILALRFGPGAGFFVVSAFALALLILFFTDLETMLLPDTITISGTVAGVLLAPWNPLLAVAPSVPAAPRLLSAVTGAALGAGVVLAIIMGWKVYARYRLGPEASEEEKAGMGLGDLKMLALIGAFVGVSQVLFVTFAAAVLGSVAGLALVAVGRGGRRMVLPFGTFLALAATAAIFVGRPAVHWYLALLGWR